LCTCIFRNSGNFCHQSLPLIFAINGEKDVSDLFHIDSLVREAVRIAWSTDCDAGW